MNKRILQFFKRVIGVLVLVPTLSMAAGGVLHLDKAPVSKDPASLQHGAKLFVNYCLNCHSASMVRYNRLNDIGLSDQLIRDNLIFGNAKVGDLMMISMRPAESKAWFGATPPDLSVIARARSSGFGSGADWLYTYLRQFYRDPTRPTGWNNVIFPAVGMPHALWELQGDQVATVQGDRITLSQVKEGTLSTAEYDKAVADLVSFMVWMGEPVAELRKRIGTFILIFLAGFFVLAYALKKNYWKDIH
jgi:ubiquinol-cytochrome c reductase cytochrome c1 subunit